MGSNLTFHKESFVLGQKTIHHLSRVMTLLMKVNQKMKKMVSSQWQIPKNNCDQKVFSIYESKLLELIKYCLRCGNMPTSYRELRNTGSHLTLLLKCNKGISDFIECFTFFHVFKGTYPTCKKYTKYMKICFEMECLFQWSLKFQVCMSMFWLYY